MDKPFKMIDEQIALLRSRGVEVDFATGRVLEREGYYSVVNGYKDVFIDRVASAEAGDDRYKQGTKFNDMHRLFVFDRDLRLAMMRYFHIAEVTLKTVCAYEFTKAHAGEREPYLDPRNYRKDGDYPRKAASLVGRLESMLGRRTGTSVDRRKPYLVHYVANHEEVPLWVLTNYMTLGQIFKFSEYQQESMRNTIAHSFSNLYNETHESPLRLHDRDLNLAFSHVKDFRNICAHDERLYCARVSPSRDTSFADVVGDLGLLLTKEEDVGMIKTVLELMTDAVNDIGRRFTPDLLKAMGIDSIDKVFLIRE